MRSGQGTSGDKGEAAVAEGTVPKAEIGANICVGYCLNTELRHDHVSGITLCSWPSDIIVGSFSG